MAAGYQACAATETSRFEADDPVGPHIRLERPLACGGMAEIWVAWHEGLGTQVAVKFLADEFRRDQLAIERFRREAKAAARVRSPHIVRHFDVGALKDGTPYIVMELLEGETVRERLDRQGPLDLATTSEIVMQVARALEAAHEVGIVHRDIKPDNIHITDGDDGPFVRVLDFGVATDFLEKRLSRITLHGAIVGTPCYLSREQVIGRECTKLQLDLWALAVVAYETLTGHLPYVADTYEGLTLAIVRGRFPAVSMLRPDLDPAIDAWFERAFNPDPAHRFSSARELAQTFVELQRPASLPPPPVDEPAPSLNPTTLSDVPEPKPRKRTRTIAALAVAAALGFLAGAENASERARALASGVTNMATGALALAQSAELPARTELKQEAEPTPSIDLPPPAVLVWSDPVDPPRPRKSATPKDLPRKKQKAPEVEVPSAPPVESAPPAEPAPSTALDDGI